MDSQSAIKFLIEDFSEGDLRDKRLKDLRAALWAFLSVRPPGDRGVVDGSVKTAVKRRLTKGQAAALQRAVRPFLRDVLDPQVVARPRRLADLRISGVQMRGFQFRGHAVLLIGGRLSAVFRFQVARLLLRAGAFLVRFGRCEAPKAGSWTVPGRPEQLCGRPFYRTRRTRRFCSPTCRARLWARNHQ
jgi:hypothetical protein